MTHAKPRRGGGHEEEHENHERWAVSYADMMTVLMALFLVLFAMSSIDVKKFQELRTSLAQGFGNNALPADSGSGIVDGSTDSPVSVGNDVDPVVIDSTDSGSSSSTSSSGSSSASISGLSTAASQELAARSEASTEQVEQQQVQAALKAKGLGDAVSTTITPQGVQITVVASNTLFASASADIQPQGLAVLDAIAPVLTSSGRQISVDGHANNLAISNSQYPNNWALAGARSTAVIVHLAQRGVPEGHLSGGNYGDSHPVYADDDPRAVEGNRRVDIVIASNADPTTAAQAAAIANGSTSTSASTSTSTTSTSSVSSTGSQR